MHWTVSYTHFCFGSSLQDLQLSNLFITINNYNRKGVLVTNKVRLGKKYNLLILMLNNIFD